MFNAFRYIKSLEAVGFKREQAEAQVQLVVDAIEVEVATKGDLAEVKSELADVRGEIASVRAEMKAEFADVRSEMRTEFASVRSEMRTGFAAIRTEMAQLETKLTFKLGAMMLTSMTVFTGVIGFLVKS